MKFTQQIKKFGTSHTILIPKIVMKSIDAKENDFLEIEVKKINSEKVLNTYFCRMCSHKFDSDDDEPYCPICESTGDEIRLELKGGKELW